MTTWCRHFFFQISLNTTQRQPALTLFLVADQRLQGYGSLHLDRHLFVVDEVLLDQLHGVSQHQLVMESQRAETVQHPAGLAETKAERKERETEEGISGQKNQSAASSKYVQPVTEQTTVETQGRLEPQLTGNTQEISWSYVDRWNRQDNNLLTNQPINQQKDKRSSWKHRPSCPYVLWRKRVVDWTVTDIKPWAELNIQFEFCHLLMVVRGCGVE